MYVVHSLSDSERQQRRSLERTQRCLEHKRHETREQAEAKARTHVPCTRCARKRVYFRAFPCPICQGWHVGHKTVRM